MDRAPREAPFPVGSRLRYVGTSQVGGYDANGNEVKVLYPGLVVEIVDTRPGRQGTGLPLELDDDSEWADDPPRDKTIDGMSIYLEPLHNRRRAIRREYRDDWIVVG